MVIIYLGAICAAIMAVVFDVDFERAGLTLALGAFLCLFVGTFVIGFMLDSIFDKARKNVPEHVTMLLALCVSLAVLGVAMQYMPKNTQNVKAKDNKASTSQYKQTETTGDVDRRYEDDSWEAVLATAKLVAYYKECYPMVWGYINKNADDPYSYLEFYHGVWGDLQEYTGDGINFDTLTKYERSLVNYPRIGSFVYFASSKSKEYHSTSKCYALLKSEPISKPAAIRNNYNPCSKCVKE